MNKSKPGIDDPPSYSENALPRIVTIEINPHTLSIEHVPDYALEGFLGVLGIVFIVISFRDRGALPVGLLFAAYPLYAIAVKRKISCTIDKQLARIFWRRGGILNSRFGAQERAQSLADAVGIEMKRHAQRNRDTFQTILVFKDGSRLQLSEFNLGFAECQDHAERIRSFLELQSPVIAVD